jgi:hypothetical protein
LYGGDGKGLVHTQLIAKFLLGKGKILKEKSLRISGIILVNMNEVAHCMEGMEGVSIHSADRQVLVSERKDNKGEIPAHFRDYFSQYE